MPNARVFLVANDKANLLPMDETAYVTEDDLQSLLARYPDLLPGDQVDPDDPRRWLLIAREMPVPGAETETGRWSLDHLFLDQDGIPTFVECKRAVDTRGRREVVAQMLDYAANGTAYWPMEALRQKAAETADTMGRTLDDEIRQLLETDGGEDVDVEAYWQQVGDNLKAGRVRLIFVADHTPRELRRLVEFLNEQMNDVEVLAVEVKQFVGSGQSVLVPRLIGASEETRKPAHGASQRHTSREEFLAKCTPEAAAFFSAMLDLAAVRGHTIYWGVSGFSVRAHLPPDEQLISFAYGFPSAQFQIFLGYLPLDPDDLASLRKELLAFGVLEEGGKHTLRANVDARTAARLHEVYDSILRTMDMLAAALPAD